MFAYCNHWLRVVVAAGIMLASAQFAAGQVQPSKKPSAGTIQTQQSMRSELSPQSSPERVKDWLLASILTTCPVPGSTLPGVFIYRRVEGLVEYNDVWSKLVPRDLTQADRLNGIQYSAWIIFGGSALRRFRPYEHKWSSWGDVRDLKQQTIAALAKNSNRQMLFAGLHQMQGFAVSMEKKNNQWSFRFEWDGGGPLDPDAFAAEKISCSAALSGTPLSTHE